MSLSQFSFSALTHLTLSLASLAFLWLMYTLSIIDALRISSHKACLNLKHHIMSTFFLVKEL